MKTHARVGLLMLAVLLVAACAPTLPQITRNQANPIRTVAVLPLVNNTNDVEGPAYVRDLFVAELGQFFYVVKPVSEVDQLLKDRMGVTLGAQLDMTTPQKLGEVLGVDGVFYGALEDFSDKTTGIYNVRRVRLRSKLVNCKTGQTVWKNGIGVKQGTQAGGSDVLSSIPYVGLAFQAAGAVSSLASSMSDKDVELPPLFGEQVEAPWVALPEQSGSVEANIIGGLVGKVVEKAMKSPLHMEALTTVSIVLKGYYYPGGADYQTYGTMLVGGPAEPPAPVKP
ncbi:MAG: GNA1162 family protein [Nitrospirota bacterium]